MAIDFDGAVALVTGGANGIGAAAARRLAAHGARVVVADVDGRGVEVATAIGGRFARCDVREQADNEAAVAAAVTAFGGLDVPSSTRACPPPASGWAARPGIWPPTGARSASTSTGSSSA
jgi:NAD(P)-dependent dehydrogenase (short-subunit alcohol dehydrogenase family)